MAPQARMVSARTPELSPMMGIPVAKWALATPRNNMAPIGVTTSEAACDLRIPALISVPSIPFSMSRVKI